MESDTVVVRGFSNTFGFDKKVEVNDLQFIEGEELERQWKVARRQRLKKQEEKIWNEFVKEEDVLKTVAKEDPYQFLDQLPEDHVKDLLECELSRIKKSLGKQGAGDSPRNDKSSDFGDGDPDEVFHIYDDEKEDGEENLNDTMESPCTVREKDDNIRSPRGRADTVARASGASVPPSTPPTEMSSENNVATVIESSIYCARVKELRIKIINEIQSMIQSLENQNIASIDSLQLRQLCRRAAEYSARYQRIHLYQLQRQVNDIKRHNSQAMPFAKHTQFQSQMVRIVALHQNTLQSLQAFHKSFEQTSCLRECSVQLRMIMITLRDSTAACRDVPVPNDFSAAKELYNDAMLAACDALENALKVYVARVDEYLAASDQALTNRSSKPSTSKSKPKLKKKTSMWSQKATKNSSMTEANARLSMYSLETLRLNKSKPRSEKGRTDSSRRKGKIDKGTPKSHRKSPRSRRPLMRDPNPGDKRRTHARDSRPDNDLDIQTMVEDIGIGAGSSHMSGDTSPRSARRSPRACYLFPRSPRTPATPPLVPPISLAHRGSGSPRPSVSPLNNKKRGNPYMKPIPANHRSETTAQTNQPVKSISRVFSKRDYRKNEDSEVQTAISQFKAGNNTDRIGSARSDFAKDASEGDKGSPNGGLDSSRSENGRTGSGWRGKGPHSARSEHNREAEGQEVTRLLKQLCAAGDTLGNKPERVGSAKNAQLVCVNATSPRQPTTPQLLRILEETIQKKIPSNLYMKPTTRDAEKMRLAFNIPQRIADNLFHYRTKFVQHMLTSSMYANSAVGKPWEMISTVSESIIDEVLAKCATEMQIQPILLELYQCETQ